jgi:alkanesulfonate monooxygenase SsuD/methylene tetrahydromethanopterin reductase-like flavin-dependent oxidoreductase (luciferase family)
VRRFNEAAERIREFAAEAGRGDVRFVRGMQVWMGVDADRAAAREKVAGSMQAFYRLPFEAFEKYTPYGTPAEVAEFIAPYVEAGCEHFNFVIADHPDAVLERAAGVREALQKICG